MGMHKLSSVLLAAPFMCLMPFSTGIVSAAALYVMTDLGTLGGANSWVEAINENGDVVGGSDCSGVPSSLAYLRPYNGVMGSIGSLGGNSTALGVNNSCTVVGRSYLSDGTTCRAFRWDSINLMTDLGTLGGVQSSAVCVNSGGDIVGWSQTTTAPWGHACFSAAATKPPSLWQDLGTLGGDYSVAISINDQRQIVGYSLTIPNTSGPMRACLWNTPTSSPIDIGDLGGTWVEANAINNNTNAVVVGRSYLLGNTMYHAFAYDIATSSMTDLQSFGGSSDALGINDAGDIVGSAFDLNNVEHAFLYSGGVMTDLNSLVQCPTGRYLRMARDINNNGAIVASMFDTSAQTYRAVLLTPIPEPSTLALFGVGALSLLAYVWRRRRS
jgi:probable HAF family extracellular repeat protein